MKTILLLFVFTFVSLKAMAQSAYVSAGGEATGTGGSSSYSIGQIAQNYSIGSNGSVAEGIQQPFEISTLGADNFPNINLEMSVYPNPTTNNITLKIGDFSVENLSYQMFDVTGKQIANEKISNSETSINLENLSSNVYFLTVTNQNKNIKNFKIIKN